MSKLKLLYLLLFCVRLTAQNEMFIDQISGRTMVRENYDSEKKLTGKQIFKAGKLIKNTDRYKINIETEVFDKNGKSLKKYTTTYQCRPEESSVLVMLFPFSKPDKEEAKITTLTKNFKNLYDLSKLNDVELQISFDSGLLNFFGSRSVIKLYDRRAEQGSVKTITSKLSAKAYAFGLRIKNLNYSVVEKLSDNKRLISQKFTENDGSYFTITYTDNI